MGEGLVASSTTWEREMMNMGKRDWIYGTAFLLVFLFASRLLWLRQSEQWGKPELVATPANASDLPSQVGNWQVVDFEHRVRNDAFGPESSMWTMRDGTKQLIVSIDGPYPEYHPLNVCYSGIGWSSKVDYLYDLSGRWNPSELNATVIEMSKDDFSGLVLFTAVDRTGKLVPAGESLAGLARRWSMGDNIRAVFGFRNVAEAATSSRMLPVYQLQVLYQSEDEISQQESQEIETLFKEVRQSFLALPRFHSR